MSMIMVKTPDEALNKVLFMKSSNLSTGWL